MPRFWGFWGVDVSASETEGYEGSYEGSGGGLALRGVFVELL